MILAWRYWLLAGHSMRHFLLLGAILAVAPFSLLAADESDSTLRLLVSSEQAPPGAVTQIKVLCDRPRVIATGGFELELDPAMFGSVAAVSVFSATGDAVGV